MLNVAVINGWLLYCHHEQLKSVLVQDLLDFTANISEILISEYKLDPLGPVLVRGYPAWSPSRSSDVEDKSAKGAEFVADSELEEPGTLHGRYDNVGQFPEHSEAKQRCKVCHSYIHIKCMKCQCHLFVTKDKNCFQHFTLIQCNKCSDF